MTRTPWTIAALLALAASPAAASERHHDNGMEVSVSEDGAVTDCSQVRVRFDGAEAVRHEERVTLPRSASPLTALRLPDRSGIWVRGADRSDYDVRICKAAATAGMLSGIRARAAAGSLAVEGPAEEGWVVHFIVEAPRDAPVDLEARSGPVRLAALSGSVRARTANGPLSLDRLTGSVVAEAENGPISLRACTGDVRAQATNGPISIRGSAGNLRVQTQNGPISVSLAGSGWENGELEAHAVNGPIALRIPEGYRSATRIESSRHSPIQCRGRACDDARRADDGESRTLEFGSGSNPVVRLSTVNGPVTVRETAGD
jgi:hypothetical protein